MSFVDDLDSSITDLPATHNNYDVFIELLQACSRYNIHQECRTNYIWVLSSNLKELCKEYYITHFEVGPFSTGSWDVRMP